MKVDWCVCSGPDASHLWDVAWFERLRDAKKYVRTLPETAFGKRHFRIERHERRPYQTGWPKKIIYDSRWDHEANG